jgi:hypothetical protein
MTQSIISLILFINLIKKLWLPFSWDKFIGYLPPSWRVIGEQYQTRHNERQQVRCSLESFVFELQLRNPILSNFSRAVQCRMRWKSIESDAQNQPARFFKVNNGSICRMYKDPLRFFGAFLAFFQICLP